MVGRHLAVAHAIVEVAGQPLGRSATLGEDQRGAVGLDQLGELLEGGIPDRIALGGEEIVDRGHDLQVELPREPGIHDAGLAPGGAGEEGQRFLDGPDGGRAADPLGPGSGLPRFHQRLQALQREGQVGAALVAQQRVYLVHDDEARLGQGGPETLGGEQDVQRLRRGDEDVRRPAGHGLPLGGERVPGPDGHPDLRRAQAVCHGGSPEAGQGLTQVLLDVVVERAERRDVDDVDPILQPALQPQPMQVVHGPEEGGQRLAGARGRDDQRVASRRDGRPALALGDRRLREGLREPAADEGQEVGGALGAHGFR